MPLDAADDNLPSIEMKPYSSQAAEARLSQRYPKRIDFDRVRDWIDNCNLSHTKCKLSSKMQLHHLRVIDCLERVVIPAPSGSSFVALSYVWGGFKFENRTLAAALPRTIEDSITATQLLGYRYLWVDRFCIDQDNAMDKHIQIQQMGAIYASAEVTLIAAVGKDPTYGLPGTSHNRSFSDLCKTVDSKTPIKGLVPVNVKIAQSAWMTRAWTFQEGFLSRRRLYITEHEILFMCNQSNRRESEPGENQYNISSPLDHTHPVSYSILGDLNPLLGLQIAMGVLEKYTSRELSYDSDALNAISGVLNSLNEEKIAVSNVWGLPFANYTPRSYAPTLCLNWSLSNPAVRRLGFPSWSPLGWKGPAKFCNFAEQYFPPRNRLAKPQNSNEYWYMNKSPSGGSLHFEITIYTIQLQVVDVSWTPNQHQGGPHIVLPIQEVDGLVMSIYAPILWDVSDAYTQKKHL